METKKILLAVILAGIEICCKSVLACPCPPCYSGPDCDIFCNRLSGYACCQKQCCFGSCCGENEECCTRTNCKSCVDNACVVCGGDPSLRCCNEECCPCCLNGNCSYACFVLQKVPFTVLQSCPDCLWYTGCSGVNITIDEHWVWRLAEPGKSGWCINAYKKEVKRVDALCEADWDATAIVKCAAESVLCVEACKTGSKLACLACLVLEGIDCAADGYCAFISACMPSLDPEKIQYTEINVADPSQAGDGCTGK